MGKAERPPAVLHGAVGDGFTALDNLVALTSPATFLTSPCGAATPMLRPRRTIDAKSTARKLDDLAGELRREAEQSELDPYDEALLAAVLGLIEAMKTQAAAVAGAEARLCKVARRA